MEAEDEGKEREYFDSIKIKDFPPNFKTYWSEHSSQFQAIENGNKQLPPWIENNKNILSIDNNSDKSEVAKVRDYINNKLATIQGQTIAQNGNGHPIIIKFNKKGNKHICDDIKTLKTPILADNIKDLPTLLQNAKFITKGGLTKPRADGIKRFYYYEAELNGKKFYFNVAETDSINKRGKIKHQRFVYSIRNSIKK